MEDFPDEIPLQLIGRLSPSYHGADEEEDPLGDCSGPSSSSTAPNKEKYYHDSSEDEEDDDDEDNNEELDSAPEVKVKVELEMSESELVSSDSSGDDDTDDTDPINTVAYGANNLRRSSRRKIPTPKLKNATSTSTNRPRAYIPPQKKVYIKREPRDAISKKKNESSNLFPHQKRKTRKKLSADVAARRRKQRRRKSLKAKNIPEESQGANLDGKEEEKPYLSSASNVEVIEENEEKSIPIPPEPKESEQLQQSPNDNGDRQPEMTRRRCYWRPPLTESEEDEKEIMRMKRINQRWREKWRSLPEEEKQERRKKTNLKRQERLKKMTEEELREYRHKITLRKLKLSDSIGLGHEEVKRLAREADRRRWASLTPEQKRKAIPPYSTWTEEAKEKHRQRQKAQRDKMRKAKEDVQRRIENGEEIPEEMQSLYLKMIQEGYKGGVVRERRGRGVGIVRKRKEGEDRVAYKKLRSKLYREKYKEKFKMREESNTVKKRIKQKLELRELVDKGIPLNEALYKSKFKTEEDRMKYLMRYRAGAQKRKLKKELEEAGEDPEVIEKKLKEFVYVPRRKCRAFKPRKFCLEFSEKEKAELLRMKDEGVNPRIGRARAGASKKSIPPKEKGKDTSFSLVIPPINQETNNKSTATVTAAVNSSFAVTLTVTPTPPVSEHDGNDSNNEHTATKGNSFSPPPNSNSPPGSPPNEDEDGDSEGSEDEAASHQTPSPSSNITENLTVHYVGVGVDNIAMPSTSTSTSFSFHANIPNYFPSCESEAGESRDNVSVSGIVRFTDTSKTEAAANLPVHLPNPEYEHDNDGIDEEESYSPPNQEDHHNYEEIERKPSQFKNLSTATAIPQPSLPPPPPPQLPRKSHQNQPNNDGSITTATIIKQPKRDGRAGRRLNTEKFKTGVPRGTQSHRKNHSDLIICEDCGFSYPKTSISNHRQTMHNPLWKDSTCQLCGLQFTKGDRWLKHYKQKHLFANDDDKDAGRRKRRTLAELHKAGLLSGVKLENYLKKKAASLDSSIKGFSVCGKCGGIFSNIKIHEATDHNPNFRNGFCLLCPDLKVEFKSKQEFFKHHNLLHGPTASTSTSAATSAPPLICSECGKKFLKMQYFNAHMTKMHGIKENYRQCNVCGNVFESNEALDKHIEDEHPDEEDLLRAGSNKKCHECGKICTSQSNLNKHYYFKHGEGSLPENFFKCEVCDERFKFKQALTNHIRFQHPEEVRAKALSCNSTTTMVPYNSCPFHRCPLCSKVVEKKKMDEHVKEDHPESNFPCQFCKVIQYSELRLRYHETHCKSRDLEKVKELKEEWKAKGVILVTNLHTKCEFCEAELTVIGLDGHYRLVHKLKEDKKLECEICMKTFKYRLWFVLHMESIHKGKVEDALEKCRYALIEKTEGIEVQNIEGRRKYGRKPEGKVRRPPKLKQDDGRKLAAKGRRPRGRPKLKQVGRKLEEKVRKPRGRPKLKQDGRKLEEKVRRPRGRPKKLVRKMQIEHKEDDDEVSSSSGTDSEEEEHSTPPKRSIRNERPTRNSAKKAKGRIKKLNRKLSKGDDEDDEENADSSSNESNSNSADSESFNVKMEQPSPPPSPSPSSLPSPPPPIPILKECCVLLERLKLNPLLFNK